MDFPFSIEDELDDLPPHSRETISWLKQFKFTQPLQELVARHRFSREELEFLKSRWILTPKKDQKKSTITKWG